MRAPIGASALLQLSTAHARILALGARSTRRSALASPRRSWEEWVTARNSVCVLVGSVHRRTPHCAVRAPFFPARSLALPRLSRHASHRTRSQRNQRTLARIRCLLLRGRRTCGAAPTAQQTTQSGRSERQRRRSSNRGVSASTSCSSSEHVRYVTCATIACRTRCCCSGLSHSRRRRCCFVCRFCGRFCGRSDSDGRR